MTRRRRGHDVLRGVHPGRIWLPDVPGHRQKRTVLSNLEQRMQVLREGGAEDSEFERLQKLIDEAVQDMGKDGEIVGDQGLGGERKE